MGSQPCLRKNFTQKVCPALNLWPKVGAIAPNSRQSHEKWGSMPPWTKHHGPFVSYFGVCNFWELVLWGVTPRFVAQKCCVNSHLVLNGAAPPQMSRWHGKKAEKTTSRKTFCSRVQKVWPKMGPNFQESGVLRAFFGQLIGEQLPIRAFSG